MLIESRATVLAAGQHQQGLLPAPVETNPDLVRAAVANPDRPAGGRLRVAAVNVAPQSFRSPIEPGWLGFDAELFRLFAYHLGVKVEPVEIQTIEG